MNRRATGCLNQTAVRRIRQAGGPLGDEPLCVESRHGAALVVPEWDDNSRPRRLVSLVL